MSALQITPKFTSHRNREWLMYQNTFSDHPDLISPLSSGVLKDHQFGLAHKSMTFCVMWHNAGKGNRLDQLGKDKTRDASPLQSEWKLFGHELNSKMIHCVYIA